MARHNRIRNLLAWLDYGVDCSRQGNLKPNRQQPALLSWCRRFAKSQMDSVDPFRWPDDFEKVLPDLRRALLNTGLRNDLQLADAEEVAQHVLTRLWVVAAQAASGEHKGRDLSSIAKLTRYAIQIARNYVKEMRMAEARRRKSLPFPDPGNTSDTPTLPENITEILKLIDEPAREAIRLKFAEDLSLQAIADRMKISKTQAHNLVQRGRKQALRRLGK